jgi:cytochrome P450
MDVERVNLLHPAVRNDPFPIYHALQLEGPVCQVDPGGMWALGRYAEVSAALRDAETFSSRGFRAALAPDWLGDDRIASVLIALDPPEHTAQRGLINRVFGRDLMVRVEAPLRAFVRDLVRRVDTAPVDVVGDLATPIAAALVAMIGDLDPSHHRRFKHWVDSVGMMTPIEPDAATAARIRAAIEEQDTYFREIIAQRRKKPGSDMLSMLLQADLDGQKLDTAQLVSFMVLLLGAGIDTTIHLISKSLLYLSRHPDLLATLREARALIPDFIEEMLRFDPPTHVLPRLTTREVRYGERTIPAHSFVLLLLAAANRDPGHFERPDEFLLERKPRGALAFGQGPHLCVGAALARFEARIVLEIMLEEFRAFERDERQPIAWDVTLHTRGPISLPMKLVRA